MARFDYKQLVEMVLYILCKTDGLDDYHVFKILYFAELKHLKKWGGSIVPDDFYALPYGPVPTRLFDAVKQLNKTPYSDLDRELASAVHLAGQDARMVLLPNRKYDDRYLSRSAIEVLDASIDENAKLTFGELKNKSHDAAWQEAASRPGNKRMSILSMARVVNDDDDFLQYVQEELELDALA